MCSSLQCRGAPVAVVARPHPAEPERVRDLSADVNGHSAGRVVVQVHLGAGGSGRCYWKWLLHPGPIQWIRARWFSAMLLEMVTPPGPPLWGEGLR